MNRAIPQATQATQASPAARSLAGSPAASSPSAPRPSTLTRVREDQSLGSGASLASGVALLTGCADKPYAIGLAQALSAAGVTLDYIGSDQVASPELLADKRIRFFNLRNQDPGQSLARKAGRILVHYGLLLRYAATARPRIFHILWHNRFDWIDRVPLLAFYRLLGKQIVFTAHNVNAGLRDGGDSWFNRLTLWIQYRLCAHIFVHTERMRGELAAAFGVPARKITVIPFGLNETVPNTALTGVEARQRLGLAARDKVILFFGHIVPYKGLEYLLEGVSGLLVKGDEYRLVIAGSFKKGPYRQEIEQFLRRPGVAERVVTRFEYIPDEETEIYFKAADLLVLPYTHVFQSGVLFLGYNFGLPVIATDVGSLKDDIIEGETGSVCPPKDAPALGRAVAQYFESDLYRQLEQRRGAIREFALARHSWTKVAEITTGVYSQWPAAPPAGED